jgi:type IV secretory pathway VirB10-like protein
MGLRDSIKNGVGGVKTRSLMVVVIIVIIITAILMWTVLRDTDGVLEGMSNVKRVKPIESLPGAGEGSVIYNPLQEQQNKLKADAAKSSGGSAVPSLLNPNEEGYGRGGFGDLNDGTGRCGDECFDQSGYDQQGFDRNGYDKNGFDKNGYDKDGYDKDGFDKQGYDRDGFNKDGCNRQGLNREGKPCGAAVYGPDGFDKDGFDKDGFDKDGFDKNGFDKNGCNREGLNKEGKPCYNAKGLTAEGFDRAGFDEKGYDRKGLDRQGFNKEGLNAKGLDRLGFNKEGCNEEGKNRAGLPCKSSTEPDFTNLLAQESGEGGAPASIQSQQTAQLERLLKEQRAQEAERMAALTAQQQAELAAQQQALITANAGLMNNQAQQLIAAWAPPRQNFVKGNYKEEKPVATPEKKSNSTLPEKGMGPLVYKAGDVAFAIIETSINSDEPGPVMARVVSGPLKGSRVLGSFERQDTKLMLTFTTLSMPDVPQSIDIDAIAIDPETARTALASDVDHHYLTKYGTLIASSFLEGMGQAVETSIGTPQLDSEGSGVIASTLPADSRDQIIVGLGKAGQRIATEINKADIEPTVTLNSGTGVGLLIMSDLRIEQPEDKVETQKNKQAAMATQANGAAGVPGAPTINVTVQSPATPAAAPADSGAKPVTTSRTDL